VGEEKLARKAIRLKQQARVGKAKELAKYEIVFAWPALNDTQAQPQLFKQRQIDFLFHNERDSRCWAKKRRHPHSRKEGLPHI
jgi:hypothetical protein